MSWQDAGSIVSRRLLLAKGASRLNEVVVLVLARTGPIEKDEYERIGLGRLKGWRDAVSETRVISVV